MDGHFFQYSSYDCNYTLTDDITRTYKIECQPYYLLVPIFNVHKRREDATIECRAPKNEDRWVSLIWAVPCNGIQECYDGEDENNCEFPFWIIPSILAGVVFVLCLAFAAYLYKYSRQDWNEIMQDRRWRLATQQSTSKESEKAFKIAVMAHDEDLDGIMNVFKTEVEKHGSEATNICYLKVEPFFLQKTKTFLRGEGDNLCSKQTPK